jgi:hypothetical protein
MSSTGPTDGGVSPPDSHLINDPNHWRQRAAEARAMAAQMGDQEATIKMERVAEDYEKLAKRAEGRLHNDHSQSGS